ncbi:hypothetical protein BDW02DRAFT_601258 [Decorospora gaudefroyi]|uniref:C3H1-type domain-containing protein n=1 Tax=Decorospora gaudefroyi TaxID=184978 RepID=A0A6A5K4C6_9PLEO|nr:hypothetical protein BDW02DRAFT_601258 [Decorospora gaudefroyi]
MATFAPTQLPSDVGDKPHQETPPQHQHQHLPPAPFSHQLNPPTAPHTPDTPQISRRASRHLRHQLSNGAMAGANGHGPMAVPGGRANGYEYKASLREMGFGGPRSPPNSKNTSHVPCKFYRQGACQAGKACPFLHSDEPMTERAPCKYFTKGNCKFGQKCALAHILPNGHVLNGSNARAHFGRMNVPHHQEMPMNSSLLTMQAHMGGMQPGYPYAVQDEYANQRNQYDMIPTIDTTFSSHPGSNYGSPPNENSRLPISPSQKGLSVMDVGLPASFDSQGISTMARYGPIASSVPAKFLANSPPSSYQADSPALRNLHDSAFGDTLRGRAFSALGSSPPESVEQPVGRRVLHSELAANRSRGVMSSSVGARPAYKDEEWDETDMIGKFEEDLLPNSLSDLLTPQEKMRRFSRDQNESENSLSHRASQSRLGVSPTASDLKYGSPSAATASPSRFQSMWAKPRGPTYDSTFESGSLPGQSAFGHVGSPLRNSSLHPGASPSLRAMNRPATSDVGPYLSSPPRQASMSMISQQLQRTRLSSREEATLTSNPVHPGIHRVTSGSSISSSSGRLGIDRAVSSSSINRERIEEEQGLFSMEEEEDPNKSRDGASTTSSNSNKRLSGLSWGSGGGKGSPNLAPVGGHRTTGSSGLGRENGPWGSNA